MQGIAGSFLFLATTRELGEAKFYPPHAAPIRPGHPYAALDKDCMNLKYGSRRLVLDAWEGNRELAAQGSHRSGITGADISASFHDDSQSVPSPAFRRSGA